ncbi:NAD(P)H-hydrate dehydratase [Microlunatus panaciterrae]|uniref:ADP-dependent (S)-NAD(P)H-hydrate dehydratase n=1 Tax=Microlunatus panaciterrae TaxID=400768 RepID=A0ABS2RNX9_9ACTN|nr:NAD(P)H-hydrate dehydratase [Microlunatus panaciterrae]MBM7800702.1 hydroxyethylthiazole kinase-like uncharacterized protein yjeF [Microlunatus panaciterrae]
MSNRVELVTPNSLREWALPAITDSKYSRGQVLVVGGAASTPGAALLAGLAAMRVGAGHLSFAVAESVATALAVAVPESGVTGLPQDRRGSVLGADLSAIADKLESADVVLVGPGLDDADQTVELLRTLVPLVADDTWLVLDAYALGVLPRLTDLRDRLSGRLVLTPNKEEAARLLERDLDDLESDVAAVADRYGAVVTCHGAVADADGARWQATTGFGGLATSGSGDVLAGAVTGLLGRGATGAQATCWATHLHAAAGDRLAARVGPLGFLARELLDELPALMMELSS